MKKIKGFTLIELIIAIAVIAVLSTIFISVVDPVSQSQKTNDARRKSDLAQIQRALEAYYNDVGTYPSHSTDPLNPYQISTVDTTDPIKEFGDSWQPYMNVVPKDLSFPKRKYLYYASSGGQSYYLYANLERGSRDLQACNNGNPCSSLTLNGIAEDACGEICNYGVSSPNVSP